MCEGGRPAFMRVVADVDRIKSYNKYLLRPLVGDSGAWADTYVTTWDILEPLKKK